MRLRQLLRHCFPAAPNLHMNPLPLKGSICKLGAAGQTWKWVVTSFDCCVFLLFLLFPGRKTQYRQVRGCRRPAAPNLHMDPFNGKGVICNFGAAGRTWKSSIGAIPASLRTLSRRNHTASVIERQGGWRHLIRRVEQMLKLNLL